MSRAGDGHKAIEILPAFLTVTRDVKDRPYISMSDSMGYAMYVMLDAATCRRIVESVAQTMEHMIDHPAKAVRHA